MAGPRLSGMTDPFAADDDNEQARRARLMSEITFGRCWGRTLPDSAAVLLAALAARGPLSREELAAAVAGDLAAGGGLLAPALDLPHVYTDAKLAEQRASFADTPFAASEEELALDADAVNADEAARVRDKSARYDRYAAAVGTSPVRTIAGVIDLLRGCQVVRLDDTGRYDLNAQAPLPAEVLPLDEDEARLQDEMRWQGLHEGPSQQIIKLFDPHGPGQIDRLRTSLERLGRQLGLDTETVRGAVALLVSEGDFDTSVDVAGLREHQVFELVVDWEAFAGHRLSLRVHRADDEGAEGADG